MKRRIQTQPVPERLRQMVLNRDGRTCKMCGQTAEDLDPYNRQPVKIKVGFIVPQEHGGIIHLGNLRTLCSTCEDGLEAIPYAERPSTLRRLTDSTHETLLAQVRRATGKDQLELLKWLIHKFPKQSSEILHKDILNSK